MLTENEGMLASAATSSLVAESLRKHGITKSVVDPVWQPIPMYFGGSLI